MTEHGLIEKQRNEHDQRQILISITSQGEYILQKLAFSHREELQIIGPKFLRALEAILLPENLL